MIYKEEKRDLFTVPEEYFLAHCISADFQMGKGIAVEFNRRFNMSTTLKTKYPNYLAIFRLIHMGADCVLIDRVFNLITKELYFFKPTYKTITIALSIMKELCEEYGIKKVAMPVIGCGLDKLKWNRVSEIIHTTFKDTDIEILVCMQ